MTYSVLKVPLNPNQPTNHQGQLTITTSKDSLVQEHSEPKPTENFFDLLQLTIFVSYFPCID